MSEEANATSKGKKRPDYIAYVPRKRSGQHPQLARIGVGFIHRNESIGVLYDAIPLGGQIVLVGIDDEEPSGISYGAPTRKPDYEANLVRDANGDSFWTPVGDAYRQEGYISILLDVVPASKFVLTRPKESK